MTQADLFQAIEPPKPPALIQLRSSQPLAIELTREKISQGFTRGLIAAPCGFGKSVVAAAFMEAAIKKGSKVWFVVDRQVLVNQMSDRLASYGIEHGVLMAAHYRWEPKHRVQVVSIQTVERRGWDTDIDLMVIDECHANLRKSLLDFVVAHPRTKIIGITATPFHKEIGKVYEYVVNPTTTNRQIDEGFLVPLKVYGCVEADMEGAKTIAGEWQDQEVTTRGRKIIGDIVATWASKCNEFFGGPVKTIVFSADVAHGREICESFAQMGYNFKQISYKDTDADARDALINEFKRDGSTIHGLVSCGVLTRGFDVTDVQVAIMARPFRKAFSEFIQQVGRVQRSHTWADGTVKEFGVLLDHAGNVARFLKEMEHLFENGVDSLQDPKDAKPPRKEPTKKEKKEMFCPRCSKMWDGKSDTCTCGFVRKRKLSTIENVPGHMQEIKLNGKALAKDQYHLYQQICTHTRSFGNPDTAKQRAFYLFKDMTGGGKPPAKWDFDSVPHVPITKPVANQIKAARIRWIKRKDAA